MGYRRFRDYLYTRLLVAIPMFRSRILFDFLLQVCSQVYYIELYLYIIFVAREIASSYMASKLIRRKDTATETASKRLWLPSETATNFSVT